MWSCSKRPPCTHTGLPGGRLTEAYFSWFLACKVEEQEGWETREESRFHLFLFYWSEETADISKSDVVIVVTFGFAVGGGRINEESTSSITTPPSVPPSRLCCHIQSMRFF